MKSTRRVLGQFFLAIGSVFLLADNAHATTSSQVLVFSNQMFMIANDLTTGLIPTTLALFSIGVLGITQIMGKDLGQGLQTLVNIVAVLGAVVLSKNILSALGLYSALM